MLAASPSLAASRLVGGEAPRRCVVARAEGGALSRRAALAAATAAVLIRTPSSLAAPAFGRFLSHEARRCPPLTRPPLAEAGDGADVSAYLPDAPDDAAFVSFRPGPAKTPALRSGVIDQAAPYRFNLPKAGRWKEAKVANAISGNVRAQSPKGRARRSLRASSARRLAACHTLRAALRDSRCPRSTASHAATSRPRR